MILTGKYSHLNGFIRNGNRFNGEQQTFPKLLQKAGYQTAMIGKWHLGSNPTGFDYWHVLKGQGPYYNPPMLTADGPIKHIGYTTDVITDLALDWLETKRDAKRPFMLMYQHKAPHRNWQPGPEHLNKYDDVKIPEPDTLFDDYSGRTSPAKKQTMEIDRHMTIGSDLKLKTPGNLTPEQKAAWNKAYGPKNEAFTAAKLEGKELVRWKVPALYQGLPPLHRLGRRQRRPRARSILKSRVWMKNTDRHLLARTRAFTWASMAGTTSVGCTKSRSARHFSCAGPAR